MILWRHRDPSPRAPQLPHNRRGGYDAGGGGEWMNPAGSTQSPSKGGVEGGYAMHSWFNMVCCWLSGLGPAARETCAGWMPGGLTLWYGVRDSSGRRFKGERGWMGVLTGLEECRMPLQQGHWVERGRWPLQTVMTPLLL